MMIDTVYHLMKPDFSGFASLHAFSTHLTYERHRIPFENGVPNCITIPAVHPKGTVLVCGGYDSFIEEFVLQIRELAARGYSVVLFEGPGQGYCLRERMYFRKADFCCYRLFQAKPMRNVRNLLRRLFCHAMRGL